MVLAYFWSSQNYSHGQFLDVLYFVGVHYDVSHTYTLKKPAGCIQGFIQVGVPETALSNQQLMIRIISKFELLYYLGSLTFRHTRKQ